MPDHGHARMHSKCRQGARKHSAGNGRPCRQGRPARQGKRPAVQAQGGQRARNDCPDRQKAVCTRFAGSANRAPLSRHRKRHLSHAFKAPWGAASPCGKSFLLPKKYAPNQAGAGRAHARPAPCAATRAVRCSAVRALSVCRQAAATAARPARTQQAAGSCTPHIAFAHAVQGLRAPCAAFGAWAIIKQATQKKVRNFCQHWQKVAPQA